MQRPALIESSNKTTKLAYQLPFLRISGRDTFSFLRCLSLSSRHCNISAKNIEFHSRCTFCFAFVMGAKLLIFTLIGLAISVDGSDDPNLPRCDWPRGVCTYVNDPCPPDIPYDCRDQMYCPLGTNKCCCRYPQPKPHVPRCDWPKGVCTYIDDPCPPDIPIDCRDKMYCPFSTNKCCCRTSEKIKEAEKIGKKSEL
ncbi:uncharacterized protein [Pocillopora verrucosa]|uniref:uncharacterized protein n=1 Tax=Pocillopora verrucosa TaxID=203993 RepID=UPI003341AA41